MRYLLFFATALLAACAVSYRGAAIEGRVVDGKSSRPIEGALVVAEWRLRELDSYNPLHGGAAYRYVGDLLITEVLTDAQGHFVLPAWGPLVAKGGRLARLSPFISVHKLGYESAFLHNEPEDSRDSEVISPGVVTFQSADRSASHMQVALRSLTPDTKPSALWPGYPDESSLLALGEYVPALEEIRCRWEKMPRLAAFLVTVEWKTRDARKIFATPARLPTLDTLSHGGACESPRVRLAALLPVEILAEFDKQP